MTTRGPAGAVVLVLLAAAAAPTPARATEAETPVPAAPVAAEPPAAAPPSPAPVPDRFYGFELTRSEVDRDKVLPGGPGRDGIPAVDAPAFASSGARDAVSDDTPVVGLAIGGDARAYLLPVLEVHQVVNDVVGGVPVVVTYDPLTGAALVFDRRVGGRALEFGVSGLLYNSGFLLYDRETESLWSQFEGRAVTGELAGKSLERVRARLESFAAWIDRNPETRILVPPAPDRFDYNQQRYTAYAEQDGALFPLEARDRRFHAKELVVGVAAGGKSRAYLASLVSRHGGEVEDEFAGHDVRVRYDAEKGGFSWEAPAEVGVTECYWFAWKAFHPDTGIWRDPGTVPGRER